MRGFILIVFLVVLENAPTLAIEKTVPLRSVLSEDCLARLDSIKPGMSRSDLEKVSTREGDFQVPCKHERYFIHPCNWGATINIAFDCQGRDPLRSREDPNDKITTVSKPYISSPAED